MVSCSFIVGDIVNIKTYEITCSLTKNLDNLNETDLLEYLAIGLAGEVGEVLNILKKKKYYTQVNLDAYSLVDELGDCLYYMTNLLSELGLSLSKLVSHVDSRWGRADFMDEHQLYDSAIMNFSYEAGEIVRQVYWMRNAINESKLYRANALECLVRVFECIREIGVANDILLPEIMEVNAKKVKEILARRAVAE